CNCRDVHLQRRASVPGADGGLQAAVGHVSRRSGFGHLRKGKMRRNGVRRATRKDRSMRRLMTPVITAALVGAVATVLCAQKSTQTGPGTGGSPHFKTE